MYCQHCFLLCCKPFRFHPSYHMRSSFTYLTSVRPSFMLHAFIKTDPTSPHRSFCRALNTPTVHKSSQYAFPHRAFLRCSLHCVSPHRYRLKLFLHEAFVLEKVGAHGKPDVAKATTQRIHNLYNFFPYHERFRYHYNHCTAS